MSKKNFIKSLIERIDFLEIDEINQIVKEYEDIIKKRTKNGEKLKDVIDSFGNIDILAKNILKERKKSKFNNFKKSLNKFWSREKRAMKRTFNSFLNLFKKKDKKQKKEKDKKNKNSSFKYKFTNMFKVKKENKINDTQEENIDNIKEEKEVVKENNDEIIVEEKKENIFKRLLSKFKKDKKSDKKKKNKKKSKSKKKGIKYYFSNFKEKFKKKNKKKKTEVKKEKKNAIVDVNIEVRKKNKTLRNIIAYIFVILLFLNSTLFFTSVIAYIDGVKLIGIPLALLSISIIYLLVVISVDDYYHFGRLSKNIKITITILVLLFFGFSIAFSIHEIYKINYVNDASEKYTIIKTSNKVEVNEKSKRYNIYFNSFYKTNYDVVIDEKLGNTIKVEVKYFECMNDLIYKTSKDSLYISLTENVRDLISFYVENLKENTIYNYKELSRYEIIIYMSSKLKEKVKIHD